MTEQAEQLTPETVTDEIVDKFFESGGEIAKEEEAAAEAPEAKKAEEPVAETEEPKEEKKVNLGALHEERARRKAEQERAKKAEERAAELEAQLKQYAQQQQQPDFEEDPVEALRQKSAKMEQFLIAQANHALQQNEEAAWRNRIAESEAAFKQDKPYFDDAIRHLADSRIEELKDLGWNEEEAVKVLRDEIRWIADKAYADEVNPAERFLALAKRRGFVVPDAEAPKKSDADTKLATIKKGMETNKTLPPASKSVKQDLTAEDLAAMKVDATSNLFGQTEFDKAWAKLFG
jgi:hypothetical protein